MSEIAQATAGAAAPARLGLGLKLAYGSGQAIDAVVQVVVNTFLLFYLTAVCGMSGSSAGSIFLVSLAVDGLLDPFIGRLSDNWRSRWGRRLPFMAGAVVPIAIAVALMFRLPAGLSDAALYAYVLALNVVLRVSLSAFALPHSALTAELTDDYTERSVISSFRALFIVLGTAAALLPAFTMIFSAPDGLQNRHAYPSLGLVAAVLVGGFGLSCILGTAKRVLQLPTPEELGTSDQGFFRELVQLFRNPSFVPLFVGAVLVLVGQGAATALNLHAYRYFWKLPTALIQLPLLVLPLGMLVGTVAAGLLLKRIEKRDGVLGAVLVVAAYPTLAALLAVAKIVTPGSPVSIALVVGNGFLFGACGALCFVCFYSMIADAVDEHDYLFGVRREALYAAALMIGAKAATGLGAFVAGLGLQAIRFSAPPEGTAIPQDTATAVGLLWGPGAALLLMISVPFLIRYRINRQHHARIVSSLAQRRSELVRA